MTIDQPYYEKIVAFLQSQDDITYYIESLTDDKNKFVAHVKHYIENKTPEQIEVTFNTAYTKLRVSEFFESIVSSRERNAERDRAIACANVANTIATEVHIKKSTVRPLFGNNVPPPPPKKNNPFGK